MNCKICGKEYDKYNSLSIHIFKKHNITVEDYSIKYLNKKPNNCLICGKLTKFRTLKQGFNVFCSTECQLQGCQKNKTYYYTLRGYSEEDAKKAISDFQKEISKKHKNEKKNINTCKEFYISRRI